jgi:Leucine-rich repeat (LRR) protein
MLNLYVKYLNDGTIYLFHSFEEIREDCIYLNCTFNKLISLEPIKKFKKLQKLNCSNNYLTSLKGIENLIQLQNLDCSDNNLTLLEGIENLIQLQKLDCCDNNLTSLEGIENLIKLQKLYCTNNQLTSLKGIENFTQLQNLECDSNKLNSLEDIKNLIQLQELYIRDNLLTSLKNIENLKRLQILYIRDNILSSFKSIKNLIQLQILDCSNNKINSLKGIENLIQLKKLYCNDNKLTSLQGIENLTQLQVLYCNYNQLTSLPLSLMNCRDLRIINYSNNEIDNLPLQLLRFINRINQGNIIKINVYNDDQNIHNSSIQLSVRDSINRLSQKFIQPFNLDELTKEILNDQVINCKEKLIEYMANKEVHSVLLLNFSEILWLVWQEINEFNSEIQIEVKKRLNEEIKEATGMCYTGKCNRVVNCLSGFSDLIDIKIQDSSQIANIIFIVKERLGEEYTVEKHKEEVKKELLERRYDLEIINEWIKYI